MFNNVAAMVPRRHGLTDDAHPMQAPTIFVQIAAYRDPQLIPTLVDLVDQAAHPAALRIVVCWQHAPQEVVAQFIARGFTGWTVNRLDEDTVHTLRYGDACVELIDIHHLQSQGACWARNKIQQHYQGERYTLQLDSHHRFVAHWDAHLIAMLESLRPVSPKPLLTTYPPDFQPDDDESARDHRPTGMWFRHINAEGVVIPYGGPLNEWETLEAPVPGRFYAAGFAFADGSFAQEVQHDPECFFYGEEISIGARAFTHGYDIYHPHRLIAWHQYSREGQVKIWDDHSVTAKDAGIISMHWSERNQRSLERHRVLFGIDESDASSIDFGKYGFGTVRSLQQYEAYVGISFRWRGVAQATIDRKPPTLEDLPNADDAWKASLKRSNSVRICVHQEALGNLASIGQCDVTVEDQAGQIMYRQTVDGDTLSGRLNNGWIDYVLHFLSDDVEKEPSRYVVTAQDKALQTMSCVERTIDRP